MCISFGGHRVDPNPFDFICPYLSTCITPCRIHGGEIRISEHSSVQSTVSKFPGVSAEAPLQTRVLHRLHTSFRGNLGGALCCGQTCIPFPANASGETPFRLVDKLELLFTCSSSDDVKASIITCGLGFVVVVFGQSFMHSGLGVGVFSLALGKGEL